MPCCMQAITRRIEPALPSLTNPAKNATIVGCVNTGAVIGVNRVGGVIGDSDGGTLDIRETCNIASVTSSGGNVGGIIGRLTTSGTISYCYNIGAINGNGRNDGGTYTGAGGIAGIFWGLIQYSYNTGAVYGSKGQVGGITGNAYHSSAVAAQYCYNAGVVSGSNGRIGSILGKSHSANVDNCFWTSTQAASGESGSVTNSSKLSETDMKAYTNDYFVADTIGVNNGYPILKWQLGNK